MKTLILIASVALAMPAMAQEMAPGEYVATAGASDLYERQSAQLVLQSTKDPKVRTFAQMMVAQHGQSTATVKAAAAKARVKVAPPKLTPLQAELIAELRAESGVMRDKAYIAQQKAAHNQALSVQKAYAEGGSSVPLKLAAAKIVPVVMAHIEHLKAM